MPEQALDLADRWIAAWNRRDLDAVLDLYADDFEMRSPLIVEVTGVEEGVLRGKDQVRHYWERGLAALPRLRLAHMRTFAGSASIAIEYVGHKGTVIEVLELNASGKVQRASAHYVVTPRRQWTSKASTTT